MIEYYIKEWSVRLLALALIVGALWGCQSTKQAETPIDFNEHRISPEPVLREEPQTFIEALRMACLQDGRFTIEHEGVEELYTCQRVDDGNQTGQ